MVGTETTRVLAIIPTYNPGPELVDHCRDAMTQAEVVVIVDDGSDDSAQIVLGACEQLGCVVLRQSENKGIASALNRGVAAAMQLDTGSEFILTLDQDSVIEDGYVANLVRAAQDALEAGVAVGMVAPEHVAGLPAARVKRRGHTLISGEPIQSGLLIPTSTIDTAEPFMTELFIDCVDSAFYISRREAGLEVVVAPGTTLEHALGERESIRIAGRQIIVGGKPVSIVRSSMFRYYYLARNRVLINRRYGRNHRRWALGETILDLRHFVVVLLLLGHRRERLRLIMAGYRDGRRGRGGKIPDGIV